MPEKRHSRLLPLIGMLAAAILLVGGYHLLGGRGISPYLYVQGYLAGPGDGLARNRLYHDLYEEYRQLNGKRSRSSIVFAGDSITKGFNIQEFAGNNSMILNRGIYHDTTRGLFARLDANINNLKIEKLFVMIGYNDLKIRPDEEIVRNIGEILAKAKAGKVYIQSLLPVSSDRAGANERILRINDQLKTLARSRGYCYVDIHSSFTGGRGGIDPELTTDGVHPNYYGYRLWYSIIEPLL